MRGTGVSSGRPRLPVLRGSCRRSAPLNYVRVLDYAVARLFLRKVGGGYIFPHRMLMDYFASLHRTKQA